MVSCFLHLTCFSRPSISYMDYYIFLSETIPAEGASFVPVLFQQAPRGIAEALFKGCHEVRIG